MTREELIDALMEDESFVATQARRTKMRSRLAATKEKWGAPVKPMNQSYFKKKKPTKIKPRFPVRWTKPVTEADWMKDAVKRPGAFRAKAQAVGASTAAFAKKVKDNPGSYDTRTKRQANLARTFAKFRK